MYIFYFIYISIIIARGIHNNSISLEIIFFKNFLEIRGFIHFLPIHQMSFITSAYPTEIFFRTISEISISEFLSY